MEAEKIALIRNYLSKNGVEYYDVQAELIDHFASAVENQQRKYPLLSFTDALHKAHQQFGGKEGFRKYQENAQDAVAKKTFKLIGLTLLQFLRWPYLFFTAAIATGWFFLFKNTAVRVDILFAAFAIGFILMGLLNWHRVRHVKMFLPKRANTSLGWIFYIFIYLPGINGQMLDAAPGFEFCVVYFTLLTLTMAAFYKVPKLAIQETRKLYPQIA